jgi:ribosome maturation factor RimP
MGLYSQDWIIPHPLALVNKSVALAFRTLIWVSLLACYTGGLGPLFFLARMADLDRDAIGKIIERVAAREGLELVHWEVVGPPGNFVLRIYIDKPGGVNHGDCEVVSNQVGTLLDVEDLVPNKYILEVSSPGIERGLYKRADYERFAGNRVKLKTSGPINGQRNFRGKLLGISEDTVSLDADGAGLIEIPYEQIAKANIEYEF